MWISLQELKELLAHLRHDRAHVVSSNGITVVQVHHSLFQIAGDRGKEQAIAECQQIGVPPSGTEAQRGNGKDSF